MMTPSSGIIVLTDEEIDQIQNEHNAWHYNPGPDDDQDRAHARLIRNVEQAVIKKLATGDAVPVAWIRRHPSGTFTIQVFTNDVAELVNKQSGAWTPLCDTTGLAKIRQQGRNEGYEAAWKQFGPDVIRYRTWRGAVLDDDQEWIERVAAESGKLGFKDFEGGLNTAQFDSIIDAASMPDKKDIN